MTGGRFLTSHPLLIGKADTPLIWLKAPTDDTRRRWGYVVERNVSLLPEVVVSFGSGLSVRAGSITVLAINTYDATSANVHVLDLRPFGMNIHGGSAGLMVGTNQMSGANMVGVRTFLKIE